jgi:hypothetical protein
MTETNPPPVNLAGVDQIAAALASVQAELPHVQKTKTARVPMKAGGSYSYKYADLPDVSQAILPVLGKFGLAFTSTPTYEAKPDGGERFVLAYALIHTSGQSITGTYPLPDPTRATPQEVGSAVTYARRYCLSSVTGIAADEDDDANAAQGAPAAGREPEQERQPGPPPETPRVPCLAGKSDHPLLKDIPEPCGKNWLPGELRDGLCRADWVKARELVEQRKQEAAAAAERAAAEQAQGAAESAAEGGPAPAKKAAARKAPARPNTQAATATAQAGGDVHAVQAAAGDGWADAPTRPIGQGTRNGGQSGDGPDGQ